MIYRPKLRQSLAKTEDEEALKQKIYEQKLQEKKELLRTEFHASKLEKGVDSSEEIISSANELKVNLKFIMCKKQTYMSVYTTIMILYFLSFFY